MAVFKVDMFRNATSSASVLGRIFSLPLLEFEHCLVGFYLPDFVFNRVIEGRPQNGDEICGCGLLSCG